MDGELIILGIMFFAIGVIKLYDKIISKIAVNKRNDFLKTLHKFELPLDTININGTYWQESVPVDVYDKELNSNDPYFHGIRSFGNFTTLDGFHKQKTTTKFNTKVNIPISYKGKTYNSKFSLPIEDKKLGIAFYIKKKTTTYVEIMKDENLEYLIRFLIDFNFLENKKITIMSTEYFNLNYS